MEIKMTHHNGAFPAFSSALAAGLAQVSTWITDETFLKYVTALSSLVFFLVAVIQLIDLLIRKTPKVVAYFRRRYPKKNS